MKTQFVITDADPIFLAALMETMSAMQAEKDQGDETESFVARFPDFESPDLEWIRDKAAEVIKTRAGIPETLSYSDSTSTHSETVLPEFRYFRNPDGDEWRVPVTGEAGQMRMRDHLEWEESISRLHHFANEAGPIGHYQEFEPKHETYVMAPSEMVRDLLREGMELAGVLAGETADVTRADRWIYNAGQFLEAFGIPSATINIPEGWPRLGIPHVEGNGTVVQTGAAIAPEPETVFGHPIEQDDAGKVVEGFEIPRESEEMATSAEAAKLRDLCELLSWERPLYGKLLAGWIAIAPICGVLHWRSHVWLTGGAGTGKSWIMSNIVVPMVGKTGLNVQSSTTEAGIRQELGSDALPVVFDEAEGEDKRSSQRIDMILELARQASTETGASIMKGSAGGKSMSFLIRSCFLFASIGVSAAKKSDTSRTTVLTLRKRIGEDQTEHFERIKNAWKDSIGQVGFTDRVRSRCLQLAKVIRENSETFSRVAVEFTGDKRSADQIGTLLAGAFSLTSNKVISDNDAHDWMARQDWTGFQAEEVDSDATRSDPKHIRESRMRWPLNGDNLNRRNNGHRA